jgi:hypothetical protein
MIAARRLGLIAATYLAAACIPCADARAGEIPFVFTSTFDEFLALNSDVSVIDFADLPEYPLPLGDQYSDLGITFTGDWFGVEGPIFPLDGRGLRGPFNPGNVFIFDFAAPIQHFGFWMEANITFTLFDGDDEIIPLIGTGIETGFYGVASEIPFDRIVFTGGSPTMDDIVFGSVIPTPAAAATLLVLLLRGGSTRQRRLV